MVFAFLYGHSGFFVILLLTEQLYRGLIFPVSTAGMLIFVFSESKVKLKGGITVWIKSKQADLLPKKERNKT